MFLLDLAHGDFKTHANQQVEQIAARRIHSQIAYRQMRPRENRCCTKEECCAGEIAGNRGFDSMKGLSSSNAGAISAPRDIRAKCPQREFPVIARPYRFFHASFSFSK